MASVGRGGDLARGEVDAVRGGEFAREGFAEGVGG